MTFDNTTISAMMSLLDDHKDEVKESDYIKICNALKFIHNKLNKQEQFSISNSINEERINAHQTARINYLTRRIAYFDSIINAIGNGRVINLDKIKSLQNVLNERNIPYTPDQFSYIVTTNERVNELENLLFSSVNINISRSMLRTMYQETRNTRVENEKLEYRNRRVDYVRELESLQNN